MDRFFSYMHQFIINNDMKKMACFWLFFTVLLSFILINSVGIKQVVGIYTPKEINMENVLGRVVGRVYAKSIMIQSGNNNYEAVCMDDVNFICEQFFQKSIVLDKLKFIQMVDNKGFLSYLEFFDLVSNQKIIMDNVSAKEDLKLKYINMDRYIRFVLLIPIILTIFFSFMAVWKNKILNKLV